MEENTRPPLTFGQKAVGITFNPGNNPEVEKCKQQFADLIDQMNDIRKEPMCGHEKGRLCSVAITELQTAQMWVVKAITWNY